MFKVVFAVGCAVCWPAAHRPRRTAAPTADIGKVAEVKPTFGPEFKVTDVATRAIDPEFFASRKLPDGLQFDPANCAKVAFGPEMPPGLQGNMAAVSAEGNGNRFVVIAVETSQALPLIDPGRDCNKVAFTGHCGAALEVVDTPKIDGTSDAGHPPRAASGVRGGRPHRRPLRLHRPVRRFPGDRCRQSAGDPRSAGEARRYAACARPTGQGVAAVRGSAIV